MSNVPAINVEDLHQMMQGDAKPVVIDVREPWENELCSIPEHKLIPLAQLHEKLNELPKNTPLVVHCHHGGRSARAVAFLHQQGFENAVNLTGGIHAWSIKIDPTVKTYT